MPKCWSIPPTNCIPTETSRIQGWLPLLPFHCFTQAQM
jgi:hypothetical protein